MINGHPSRNPYPKYISSPLFSGGNYSFNKLLLSNKCFYNYANATNAAINKMQHNHKSRTCSMLARSAIYKWTIGLINFFFQRANLHPITASGLFYFNVLLINSFLCYALVLFQLIKSVKLLSNY